MSSAVKVPVMRAHSHMTREIRRDGSCAGCVDSIRFMKSPSYRDCLVTLGERSNYSAVEWAEAFDAYLMATGLTPDQVVEESPWECWLVMMANFPNELPVYMMIQVAQVRNVFDWKRCD